MPQGAGLFPYPMADASNGRRIQWPTHPMADALEIEDSNLETTPKHKSNKTQGAVAKIGADALSIFLPFSLPTLMLTVC
ncbi:hypothetical protein [Azospirillum brasilense]|uniref:hypothetical protein n=1 Tax=Azospirillum brasilense TaxID=192 RepID=UPI0010BFB120|nr:hypothetical protein [Azospirillum brasilense]